jgi:hypothetical protein
MILDLKACITFLLASKVDDLKKKHPTMADAIDQLVLLDPSGTNKYLTWMLKQVMGGVKMDDIARVVEAFDKQKRKLAVSDITNLSFAEAKEATEKAVTSAPAKYSPPGSDVLWSDKDWTLVLPLTLSAVKKLGKGTQWCISADRNNRWDEYLAKNARHYMLFNKSKTGWDANRSYCLTLFQGTSDMDLRDGTDTPVPYPDRVLGKEVWDKFKATAQRDLDKRGDTWLFKLNNATSPDEVQQIYDEYGSLPEVLPKLAEDPTTPDNVLQEVVAKDPELEDVVLDSPNASQDTIRLIRDTTSSSFTRRKAENLLTD